MHTKRNPEGTHSAKRLIQNHSPFHAELQSHEPQLRYSLSKTRTSGEGPTVCHTDQ